MFSIKIKNSICFLKQELTFAVLASAYRVSSENSCIVSFMFYDDGRKMGHKDTRDKEERKKNGNLAEKIVQYLRE